VKRVFVANGTVDTAPSWIWTTSGMLETEKNPLAVREGIAPVKDLDWTLCSANEVDERKASLKVEPTGAKVIAAISRPGGRKERGGAAKAKGGPVNGFEF